MSAQDNTLDVTLIRELATILSETDLGEIEVEQGKLRIRIKRAEAPASFAPYPAAPIQAPPPASATVPAAMPPASAHPKAVSGTLEGTVKSPMVGTAYLSPEPDTAPFIKVGDKVTKGQTLLLIEAMKTFNAVEAPEDGTVSAILVKDAQSVEFGEPLIVIE